MRLKLTRPFYIGKILYAPNTVADFEGRDSEYLLAGNQALETREEISLIEYARDARLTEARG